jgi:hypothetical protein
MRVVVSIPDSPYLHQHPTPAVTALRADGVDPEIRYTSGEVGYWELLNEFWSAGDPFILVEHDVLVWPGAIDILAACTFDFCGFPYLIEGRPIISLGCIKLGGPLMEVTPRLLESMDPVQRGWRDLDARFFSLLRRYLESFYPGQMVNQLVHEHHPAVVHLTPRSLPRDVDNRRLDHHDVPT